MIEIVKRILFMRIPLIAILLVCIFIFGAGAVHAGLGTFFADIYHAFFGAGHPHLPSIQVHK